VNYRIKAPLSGAHGFRMRSLRSVGRCALAEHRSVVKFSVAVACRQPETKLAGKPEDPNGASGLMSQKQGGGAPGTTTAVKLFQLDERSRPTALKWR
jgi:hypothetical protein